VFVVMSPSPPSTTPLPYTTLFRSGDDDVAGTRSQQELEHRGAGGPGPRHHDAHATDLLAHDLQGVHESGERHDRRAVLVVVEHRSEEHTSELQSRENLVCRLLLEK